MLIKYLSKQILTTGYWLLPTIYCLPLLLLTAACASQMPTPGPAATTSPTALPTVTSTTIPLPTPTQTPSPTKAPSPTQTPTTIAERTVVTVWQSLSDAQIELLLQDIRAFETDFPQYEIKLQYYNTPQDFLPAAVAGEFDFDVVLAPPDLLSNLQAAQQLNPMSDFFSPGFMDEFAAVTLAGASRDGEIWGLPDTAGFHLMLFYNRDLVDIPPDNTDDLADMAQDLTTRQRRGLGLNSYEPLWLTPWLAAYGGWLTDDEGNPTLASEAMVEALTLHQSWHTKPEAIAAPTTYDDMRDQFLAGDLAMLIDGEWAIAELSRSEATGAELIEWGVAQLPAVSQAEQPTAPLVLARYWAVSQDTEGDTAQATVAFLEFITNPQRQLTWLTQFGLLPTQRQALDDPIIVNDPAWRVSAAQMQAGRAIPLGVNTNAILNAMRDPLQQVVEGNLTPANATEIMQENIER